MAIKRRLNILHSFFRSRITLWILGLSVICSIFVAGYFFRLRPIQVFPSNGTFKFCFFTDTANQGNSRINRYSISDSFIEMQYELKKGFVDPYVSISISPLKDSMLNIMHYNRIIIDMEGFNTENIGFDIFTPYTIPTAKAKDTIVDFYNNIINISTQRKQYVIDFQELKVPDYWYVNNNLSPDVKIEPDLQHVLSFNIGTAYAKQFNEPRSLRIYNVRFERNNNQLIVLLIAIEILLIVLLFIMHYIREFRVNRRKSVTISYKPVEMPLNDGKNNVNSCMEYINGNFHEPELTLEKAAGHLGINQRTIASTIQDSFGCNFKTYLNQLRIHESKRLLKETDLSIGEVAYKVGYNTQSHFNRVFKSVVGVSPSEFREANPKSFS